MKQVFDLADDLFKGNPTTATKLKLAKLLEANPGIEAQLEKVNAMMAELNIRHGTAFHIMEGPLPDTVSALPGIDSTSLSAEND